MQHVLGTATALVNTGSPAAPEELLPDVEAVRSFISDRIITEVEPPVGSDLPALYQVRSQLRGVYAAPDDVARTPLINDLLSAATIRPRLVDHDDLGSHLHFFPAYASLSEHLLADCAMALAETLAAGESGRLQVCSAPDCSRVYVDASRNRSRAYCDGRKCGNRMHAAAYRGRRRA